MEEVLDSFNNKNCNCCLCKKVSFLKNNSNKIKTTTLCVLILKALGEIKPEKEFYSMRQDIYDFVGEHWNCVKNFSIFTKPNWKKMLLDTFNHCTNIETGKNYGLRASFRIKNKQDENTKSESFSESKNNEIYNDKSVARSVMIDRNSNENYNANSSEMFNDHNLFENYDEMNTNNSMNYDSYNNENNDYLLNLNSLRFLLYNNVALMKKSNMNSVIPDFEQHCTALNQSACTFGLYIDSLIYFQ